MRRILAAAALLALAACGKAQSPTPTAGADIPAATPTVAAACTAQSGGSWEVGGKTYRIEARAEGATCPQAIATLRILAPSGEPVFETQHRVADVPLAFRAGDDQAELQSELDAWTANVSQWPNAEGLPPWPQGAVKPQHMIAHSSRDDYEAARTARLPIFCFPDGGESNACVALNGATGRALLMGSWTPERF